METSLSFVLQAIANGLAMGGLYILVALGLTLILSIMGILQLAHGEIYMIGAYLVYYLTSSLGISLYIAILISMGAMGLIGLVLERGIFRPCKGDFLSVITVAIALTLILRSYAVAQFGLFERTVPKLASGSLVFFGVAVPKDRFVAMLIAAAMSVALYLFLKMTRYGQAMFACAQNPEGARLRGINPDLISPMAMMIGCALAAAGGAIAGSIWMLTPTMGTLPLVKGLIIIVIGGMGSLSGAIVAGIFLGLMDGIIPVFFGPVVTSIAPLVIVVLILLVKPQGLFGHG
ncbi:MAG: branched-chain amino acid ABC transporter permease [Desulfobacteraceae bacterium]|nr:branched-chain amino acid ABC transporter permease [Desulfobacteraceae bacterium]